LIEVHRLSPELRIVGLDASPTMVERARTHLAQAGLADAVEVVLGNANDMPFPDASFDAVVSTGSIHHWKNPVGGLNEAHRVLKPGGCALIYDLVRGAPGNVLRETRREFGLLRVALFWVHAFEEPFYRQDQLESLAASSRFKRGQVHYVGLLCCLAMQRHE
jgi:ubiquinone/menaquinone biosynthesis C-methylase UbiE